MLRTALRGKRPTRRRYTGGVDLYVGGTEHAVLHLLYARFWHKVLFDLGHLSSAEPFQRLVNQGIILGEDGRKMSKRWGNVIDPLDVIAEYGADAFRCYEMFMGPLEQMKPWSMTGVEGVSRFLARVWRLMMEENQAGEWILSTAVAETEPTRAQQKVIHATIKKVERRHRSALLQHRDRADDDFRERLNHGRGPARLRSAHVAPVA